MNLIPSLNIKTDEKMSIDCSVHPNNNSKESNKLEQTISERLSPLKSIDKCLVENDQNHEEISKVSALDVQQNIHATHKVFKKLQSDSEQEDCAQRKRSFQKRKLKKFVLNDSESDKESTSVDDKVPVSRTEATNGLSKKQQSDSEQENSPKIKDKFQKRKLKTLVLNDSESDKESTSVYDEVPVSMTESTNRASKKTQSDSEQEDSLQSKRKLQKRKLKKFVLDDSESDKESTSVYNDVPVSTTEGRNSPQSTDENLLPVSLNGQSDKKVENFNSMPVNKSMFQDKDLYDAEGSSDEETPNVNGYKQAMLDETHHEKQSKTKNKKRANLQRKSKQSALEEIHSETQRLIRHSRVALPYHQPKQHSLSEFLSRRKVLPIMSIKTPSNQLSEVWESIEEREKTAEEFYKSGSDSCEEDNEEISFPVKPLDDTNKTVECTGLQSTEEYGVPIDKPSSPSQLALSSESTVHKINIDINDSLSKLSAPFDIQLPSFKGDALNKSSLNLEKNKDNTINVDKFEYPDTNFKEISDKNDNITDTTLAVLVPNENREDNRLIVPSEQEDSEVHLVDKEMYSENTSEEFLKPMSSGVKLGIHKKCNSLLDKTLLDVKLDVIPKITGKPDEVIDLDSGSEKPAALQLVSRFMKHVSLKSKRKKQEDNVSVAVTEVNANGEVISLSEEIISIKAKEKAKPGVSRVQLKETLKQKIAQSREEQLVKRFEEYKLSEELIEGDEYAYNISDIDDPEEEEIVDPSELYETESEPEEENDIDMSDKKKVDDGNPFVDNEAEESDDSSSESGSDDEIEEESDAYSDPPSVDVAPLLDNKDMGLSLSCLNEASSANGITDSTSNNDFLVLCSGVFPSQAVNLSELEKNDNTELPTENLKLAIAEHESLCTVDKKASENNDSSDEEVFSKKTKKKVKLTFSDDEDDDQHLIKSPLTNKALGDESETEVLSNHRDEDEIEDDTKYIDDEDDEAVIDEEEEEALFHDPSAAAKRFLEDEAELSGSEYGSADEDEVDLDNYEEEQGDQDKLNQKKLKSELERIHMKEIMDEDKREIRILQELLLEDGELHSDGPRRQRQFKWYNQDDGDADRMLYLNSFDDDDIDLNKKEENEEDEEDESWRKTRLERENYLEGMKNNEDDIGLPQILKKFNKVERQQVKPAPKVPTNSSPNPKKNFSLISKRGSFLSRGEKVLSKLAELTNASGDNLLGKSRGKKNMVFAVVSPPKEEIPQEEVKKRKSNDVLLKVTKKLKFSPGNVNNNRKSIFENLD